MHNFINLSNDEECIQLLKLGESTRIDGLYDKNDEGLESDGP